MSSPPNKHGYTLKEITDQFGIHLQIRPRTIYGGWRYAVELIFSGKRRYAALQASVGRSVAVLGPGSTERRAQ
jgi:hypothetical protein